MQARLRDLARERAVDLIFASRSVGWIAASPVARRLGLPLVWRGGGRPTGRGQRVSLRFLARLWRPDALVCNCEAVRRDLEPLVRAPSYIVHNGVDTARFDPQRVVPRFRRDAGIGPDVPVVGFSGRPAPEKGLEVLGAALVRVARDLPNLRVFIAGEFGWRAEYERLFGALGLAERTTFLGHVQDIESVYASCDVIALTSHNHSIEGSPNAVLEAMAMERPIVATAVGGLPELIQDGVQGFLVPAEDAAGLATHLGRLLGDPALRRQLGAAGRATIVESYDDRSVTRRLASVLQLVAARAAARHLPTPPLQLGLNAHQH
jgi:glycosyltransferase involved in cell wall biosynthesis